MALSSSGKIPPGDTRCKQHAFARVDSHTRVVVICFAVELPLPDSAARRMRRSIRRRIKPRKGPITRQ
jgi:hypothetical protein